MINGPLELKSDNLAYSPFSIFIRLSTIFFACKALVIKKSTRRVGRYTDLAFFMVRLIILNIILQLVHSNLDLLPYKLLLIKRIC